MVPSRSLVLALLVFSVPSAWGQIALRSDGSSGVVEGATSQSLADSLMTSTLTNDDVDLFVDAVEMLVLVLPTSPGLAADLSADTLPLSSLSTHAVWLAVDGGIDCRDFIGVLKKIAIALPLTDESQRPAGFRSANCTVVRNRRSEVVAALKDLKRAVSDARGDS